MSTASGAIVSDFWPIASLIPTLGFSPMSDYLLFATAFFAAAVAPGADTFLILSRAIENRRLAVIAGAGITAAKVLMVTIAFLGLNALLESFPGVLVALKIFGAGFLSWRAYKLWTSKSKNQDTGRSGSEFFSAFAIGFSNPQPFTFYLSIVPIVVGRTELLILLGIVVLGFALVTFIYVSIAAGFSRWLSTEKNFQLINRLLAGVFLILALVIIVR
jgi:threonine/homoserine/homoserine lactone efflux protein